MSAPHLAIFALHHLDVPWKRLTRRGRLHHPADVRPQLQNGAAHAESVKQVAISRLDNTGGRLTILNSLNCRHATKRFTLNKRTGEFKSRSSGNEHHFRVESIALGNFAELCAALTG
jgi:hypothetical protein